MNSRKFPIEKKILFLCTGNSCRSQMAEGWCRFLWGDQYQCYSAGTQKHGLNQRAVLAMQNAGVDISGQHSKTTDELPAMNFDFVITVCDKAKESCPYFPGGKIIHLGFDDPPALAKGLTEEIEIMEIYEKVCHEIREKIKNLPEILGDENES